MRDEFLNDICIDWIRTCAQLLMDGALSEFEGAVQRFSEKTGLLCDDNLQVKYWIWIQSEHRSATELVAAVQFSFQYDRTFWNEYRGSGTGSLTDVRLQEQRMYR